MWPSCPPAGAGERLAELGASRGWPALRELGCAGLVKPDGGAFPGARRAARGDRPPVRVGQSPGLSAGRADRVAGDRRPPRVPLADQGARRGPAGAVLACGSTSCGRRPSRGHGARGAGLGARALPAGCVSIRTCCTHGAAPAREGASFLRRLRYVVIDDVPRLPGVFGSMMGRCCCAGCGAVRAGTGRADVRAGLATVDAPGSRRRGWSARRGGVTEAARARARTVAVGAAALRS